MILGFEVCFLSTYCNIPFQITTKLCWLQKYNIYFQLYKSSSFLRMEQSISHHYSHLSSQELRVMWLCKSGSGHFNEAWVKARSKVMWWRAGCHWSLPHHNTCRLCTCSRGCRVRPEAGMGMPPAAAHQSLQIYPPPGAVGHTLSPWLLT